MKCRRCQTDMDPANGDNFGDLCPGCADATEAPTAPTAPDPRTDFAQAMQARRDSERCYRVVRCYMSRPGQRRTLAHGLTLAEAQEHCRDPETSSKSATSAAARARTRRHGQWFDAYELDTPNRRHR